MEFRVLGPFEVREEGRPIPVGGARQRALLAVLVLRAGQVVASDRLLDEVWGEQGSPGTGSAALQARVSALRKTLRDGSAAGASPARLLTRPGGYLLRADPEEVDASRFVRLLEVGRRLLDGGEVEQAASTLAESLALWRGPALADFSYEPFAQATIARLEERRLEALECRFEADLALARHAGIVGELEAHVAEHPLREQPRAQLMLALYRCERQAEALATYQQARRLLADELGVEPGAALRALHQAVLQHDPGLLPAPEARVAPVGPQAPGAHVAAVTAPPPRPPTPEPSRRKPVTVTCTVLSVVEDTPLDPERRAAALEQCLVTATGVLHRHGGTVLRLPGQTLAAVFGHPAVHEDDASRAVRAGEEVGVALDALAGPLHRDHHVRVLPRTGVGTGEVVVGSEQVEDVLTSGTPAARADSLARACSPGSVLVDARTRLLLDRSGRRTDTPMVGRGDELAQMRLAFQRAARTRRPHLFTVLGPAGIGKSRLAREVIENLDAGVTVLEGHCPAYGEGVSFWPLREVVAQATRERGLSELLDGEEYGPLVADRLSALVGVPGAEVGEDAFWAVARFLEALARSHPLVLVLEDLHWAEPTMLALVEYLASWPREAPVLLLCLARSDLLENRPTWAGGVQDATTLLLDPLSDGDSDTLLDRLLEGVLLPADVRARVHEVAEGNPLFLEQLLASLAESPSVDDVTLPPTIEVLLAARLDRLGPGERAVLERAAVVGRAFWREPVVHLLPEEARPTTDRHLAALVRRDFVHPERARLPGVDRFAFRHALVQEAAYRATPKAVRADLHARFSAWLEDLGRRRGTTFDDLAGYHAEQALRYRLELGPLDRDARALASDAARLLSSAGHQAFHRGDMPGAAGLLQRAVSLPGENAGTDVEALPDLGYALFELGEFERADEVLGWAAVRAHTAGDRRAEWRAVVKRAHMGMYSHPDEARVDELTRIGEEAVPVQKGLGDDLGLARTWTFLSDVDWMRGRGAVAQRECEDASAYARRAGSERDEAWAWGAAGVIAVDGPRPVAQGLAQFEALLAEASASPVMEANVLPFLALLEAMDGRLEVARAHMTRGREITGELGLRWQASIHAIMSADLAMLAGEPAAAERELADACRVFRDMGDRWFWSTAAIRLPAARYAQGRHAEARAAVEALDEVPARPDMEWQVKRRGTHARLLAADGRADEAERLAAEAVSLAEGTDLLLWQGDALATLAEVLTLTGRPEQAAGPLRRALDRYVAKGHRLGAVRLRRALGAAVTLQP